MGDSVASATSNYSDATSNPEGTMEELTRLEKELSHIHSINNDIIAGNEEKDELLTQKEELVKYRTRIYEEELDQITTEYKCLDERVAWEKISQKTELERAERLLSRSLESLQEAKNVEEGIRDILRDHAIAGREHAQAMHDSNISIKNIRRNMEEQFRKELIDMDAMYMDEAFNILDDTAKKDLLGNAKLKDEVGLQRIGLSNMSVRLQRERNLYIQSKVTLRGIEAEAARLRTRIDGLHLENKDLESSIAKYDEQVSALRDEYESMQAKIALWPDDERIRNAINACACEEEELAKESSMWEERLRRCRVIQADLRPFNSLSGSVVGAGPSAALHASTSLSTMSGRMPRQKFDINSVQELMKKDHFFHEAVREFLSTFSLTLCGNGVAELDTNTLLWLLKELQALWNAPSAEEIHAKQHTQRARRDDGIVADVVETATETAVLLGAEDTEDEAFEALLEGAQLHDTAAMGRSWLERPKSPRRLPPPESTWATLEPTPPEPETGTVPLSSTPNRKPPKKPLQGIEEVVVPQGSAAQDIIHPPLSRPARRGKTYDALLKTGRILQRMQAKATQAQEMKLGDGGSVESATTSMSSMDPTVLAMNDPMVTRNRSTRVKLGGTMQPSKSMPALRNRLGKLAGEQLPSGPGARKDSEALLQTIDMARYHASSRPATTALKLDT